MPGTSDLISREKAIDLAYDCEDEFGKDVAFRLAYYLRHLPSAQPERKTGKWIEVNDAYNRISGRCSVCGWESHLYEDDVVGMDYCPNCGARLEVE